MKIRNGVGFGVSQVSGDAREFLTVKIFFAVSDSGDEMRNFCTEAKAIEEREECMWVPQNILHGFSEGGLGIVIIWRVCRLY